MVVSIQVHREMQEQHLPEVAVAEEIMVYLEVLVVQELSSLNGHK